MQASAVRYSTHRHRVAELGAKDSGTKEGRWFLELLALTRVKPVTRIKTGRALSRARARVCVTQAIDVSTTAPTSRQIASGGGGGIVSHQYHLMK
jgi:hypothetical protein